MSGGSTAPPGRSCIGPPIGPRPELLPVLDDARAARFLRFPLGRPRVEGQDPGARGALRAGGRRQAGQPGHRFVPDGDYAAVIEKLRPGAAEPGDIVASRRPGARAARGGDPLHRRPAARARHRRRRAAFVVRLDAEARRVVVGPRAALARRSVPVAEVNWLGDGGFEGRRPRAGRSRCGCARPGRRSRRGCARGPDRAEVELLAPEEGVAPGQACVFYAPRAAGCSAAAGSSAA